MRRRALAALALAAVLCLAFGLGGLFSPPPAVRQAGGFRLTYYPIPRQWRVGDHRVGLRVQDGDYRIRTDFTGTVHWRRVRDGQRGMAAALKPGPGKDLRAWLRIPEAGAYDIVFNLAGPQGGSLTAVYRAQVPPSRRRKRD